MSAIPMNVLPGILPQGLQASARPLSRYLAPTLVGQRKSVVSVGATGRIRLAETSRAEMSPIQSGPIQSSPASFSPAQSCSSDARHLRRAESDESAWAFYRKHTERMLRQYLHASMQVSRAPELLEKSVGRGWVSSRKVKTFEDAVIFVLDMERCLKRLSSADRLLLERVVLQEYTYQEAANLMGLSLRVLARKVSVALDRLTELLVADRLLVLAED